MGIQRTRIKKLIKSLTMFANFGSREEKWSRKWKKTKTSTILNGAEKLSKT